MAIKVAGQEVISDTRKITGGTALDLTPIEATIADTAVDVFVYDTRKDSDGGAWRKRTQHTSWYNETLNTATRGSRKEFPAVAVIVAESNQVTIYDGDDPDLPMWMVFNTSLYNMLNPNNIQNICTVSAINGKYVIGKNTAYGGIISVDFIADEGVRRSSGTLHKRFIFPISGRNQTSVASCEQSIGDTGIVQYTVNDVAMTVLPNAPIDPATQLPIPTIAVATDGGVSVIKDDGTVVDFTQAVAGGPISIGDDGIVYVGRTTPATNVIYGFDIPASDISAQDYYYATNQAPYLKAISGGLVQDLVRPSEDSIAFGYNDHLGLIQENRADTTKGSVAYITSTYNTGWMNGDIKLATLSDTDATNVTGAELVTNGDFPTNTAGWTAQRSATLTWETGGYLRSTTGGVTLFGHASQGFSTVVGKRYTLEYTIQSSSGGDSKVKVSTNADTTNGVIVEATHGIFTGTFSLTFVATTTTTYVGLGNQNFNAWTNFDNISVRLAEEDRSVNGNGLQVFGTITKTPVATGADLVAYSGWSSNNYVQQPYNSDLDFGTGDFSVNLWVTGTTGGVVLLERLGADQDGLAGSPTDLTGRLYIYTDGNGYNFYVGTTNQPGSASGVKMSASWSMITLVRRNGVCYCYQDGVLKSSFTASGSVGASDHILRIGTGIPYVTAPWVGNIGLVRISATAPTAEQIAKIYEDEKVLFQEGAQATLYGSSDAVTALAYDEDESILRVGTSSGRSDFSGLRRVSNTTTGVTTAISSSNGMVVEQ